MTRSRTRTYTAFAFSFLIIALPHLAFGAGFTGSIVPQSGSCVCAGSAPDWGCVLQVLQNVITFAVYLGVILCVMWIAYAGFSMMVSGGNAEARSQAKTRIVNAVVGIAVILCSWIIVDFVMKTIYEPNTVFQANIFGPWNSILAPNGDDYCIKKTTPMAITSGSVGVLFGTPGNESATYSTGTGTGSCNPQEVAQAAASGGYQLTAAQANTLACLAQPESTCGADRSTSHQKNGQATSASGPWQIIVGANDKCHSLNIPACGNLNCSAAFKGGVAKSDPASQALAARCKAAANTLSCSASAAACLVQQRGGKFSDWTSTKDGLSHATQQACVTHNGQTY